MSLGISNTVGNVCKPTALGECRLRQPWARTGQRLLWSLILALGWGAATPSAKAAERVTVRLGPFEQPIAIADLKQFAKTGELPPALELYAPVLTPQVREVLNRRLQLNQHVGDKLIDDLLRSATGEQLIKSLQVAMPNSTLPQLQTAAALAARQGNGLSVVGFLQAYPQENITVDASSAIALALQFNRAYWQTQALGPLLESKLAVASDTPFKPGFDPALPGTQIVHQQTLIFQDRQRHPSGSQSPTEGNPPAALSHRTIPVDLYWGKGVQPTAPGQQPLVVISHGFGADRKFLAYLALHLASHGLTVAALEHPGSNITALASVLPGSNPYGAIPFGNASGVHELPLLPATEFVDRPKDVSFLLDELAKLNQQPGPLQGKLNTQQVSVIGHSLGGYTALALAGAEVNLEELRQFCKGDLGIGQSPSDWLECAAADLPDHKLQLKDKRVASAIALNPLVGHLFGKTGLTQVATPVLLLGGTEDALTPLLNHQLRPFTQIGGSKYLITAIGGTHLSVGDPANLGDQATATTLVKERLGEETKSLRQLVQGVSLAFIKQTTPEAKTYEQFLTPAYAQSLSTPHLPLRLNTELPVTIALSIQVVDSNWGLLINLSANALSLTIASTGLIIIRRRSKSNGTNYTSLLEVGNRSNRTGRRSRPL